MPPDPDTHPHSIGWLFSVPFNMFTHFLLIRSHVISELNFYGRMWWSHWSSMLRWFWPILECNLNDQGLPEMAPRRWPVFCGNPKQNSQSTTHTDPKVGTGGMLHWEKLKGTQAPACRVSGKGPNLRFRTPRVFQLNQHNMDSTAFHFGHFVFDNAPHLTRCAPICGWFDVRFS